VFDAPFFLPTGSLNSGPTDSHSSLLPLPTGREVFGSNPRPPKAQKNKPGAEANVIFISPRLRTLGSVPEQDSGSLLATCPMLYALVLYAIFCLIDKVVRPV